MHQSPVSVAFIELNRLPYLPSPWFITSYRFFGLRCESNYEILSGRSNTSSMSTLVASSDTDTTRFSNEGVASDDNWTTKAKNHSNGEYWLILRSFF
jgi:hypothetical protein